MLLLCFKVYPCPSGLIIFIHLEPPASHALGNIKPGSPRSESLFEISTDDISQNRQQLSRKGYGFQNVYAVCLYGF